MSSLQPVYVLVWKALTGDMIDFSAGFFYTKDQAESWIKNNIVGEDQEFYEVRTLIYGLLPRGSDEAFYGITKYPRRKEPNEPTR